MVGRIGLVQHGHEHAVGFVFAQPAAQLDRDLPLQLTHDAHDLAGSLGEACRMADPVHGEFEVIKYFVFKVVFVLEDFVALLALVTVIGRDLEFDGGASASAGFRFGRDDGVAATFHLHKRIFLGFCEVNARCPKDLGVHLCRE